MSCNCGGHMLDISQLRATNQQVRASTWIFGASSASACHLTWLLLTPPYRCLTELWPLGDINNNFHCICILVFLFMHEHHAFGSSTVFASIQIIICHWHICIFSPRLFANKCGITTFPFFSIQNLVCFLKTVLNMYFVQSSPAAGASSPWKWAG